jgi:DtxR family Mn-dependent transcriptional regulator
MNALPTISTALEDYLEAIVSLVERKGTARTRDIAAALKVHKSTVTAALRSLAEKGLINYSAYEAATLTTRGRKAAEDVVRRHEIVRDFFVRVLALDEETADANACRMEHVLDSEVLERLRRFAAFVQQRPAVRRQCLAGFRKYLEEDAAK